ncbi:uncharacterized protein PGTG_22814 [Puccinia graminis f. sp. tritici CRL 75-36-700-3]|uniref:No apical meristem-associated C-terminal domain-containing protein n=1 Tax=Puccinia graminis f. sp. tritici (strain CRL 75-36-700-3 / race SCCL) TaxID=418459 RepID=H6QVP3_PUCGT|nr:uncharacterized protein PGTG_22814 [Puccinia graminis f. sp. tritici CRL 75-36-700-3]EHS63665.1 hypothetical protein PGTG_22814 [Puccinia graminis f. sp. tritici CRL 75-36-700-3]
MSTTDDTPSSNAPTPKNPTKKTVKPKPKKVVKNKKKETPKANATPKAVQTPNVIDTPIAAETPKAAQTPKTIEPVPNQASQSEAGADDSDSEDEEGEKKSRAPNYQEHEDLQLCTSWLETTEDGRKGTDQTGKAFWGTVTSHYHSKITDPKRSIRSIKGRWGLIQHALNKFHGCVNQINHRNPSGTTATNRISMALSLFTQLHDKPFTYMCCYNLLSTSPKWHEYNISMDKKHEVKKAPNPNPSSPLPGFLPSSTPADTTTSDASEDESTQQEPTRPIGRKKSKIAYQEEKLDASNHEHLKKMASAHVDIAEAVKNQKDSISAQQSALERLADEAIMSKDLTGADEDVRRYYSLQRKKILARLEKEVSESAPAAPST